MRRRKPMTFGDTDRSTRALDRCPPVSIAHVPTPLEPLGNLRPRLELDPYAKRDDCTGLAFGGNKVRR